MRSLIFDASLFWFLKQVPYALLDLALYTRLALNSELPISIRD